MAEDELICRVVAASGAAGTVVINATEPDFSLRIKSDGARLMISAGRRLKKADLDISAEELENVLSGVRNLMIGLNRRALDCGEPEMIQLLLDVQPALARSFRRFEAERREAGA